MDINTFLGIIKSLVTHLNYKHICNCNVVELIEHLEANCSVENILLDMLPLRSIYNDGLIVCGW